MEKNQKFKNNCIHIDFEPFLHLPIFEKENEIFNALKKHSVVLVSGATGSGKSTQLGKLALKHGFSKIAHTQPRRLAAQTLAYRVAQELNVNVGQGVGLSLRFIDQTSPNDFVTFLTDGLLLAKLNHNPLLKEYDLIILDEAHERSLNIDFLLAYFKILLRKRPHLKIIITSATIDLENFSKHFNNAPIIEVSGRLYPVRIHYLKEEPQKDILEVLIETLENIILKEGDILVFLPTEKYISDSLKSIKKNKNFLNVECLPLYARLPLQKQKRIFQKSLKKRIILATNVAETSITVPNIRFVVDLGLARIKRFHYHQRIERLPIEKISRSAAAQRLGRAGRVQSGECFRLYTEEDFNQRPAYNDAEILRSNLANVLLKIKSFQFNDLAHFPLLDSPDQRAWQSAEKTLIELDACDENGHLTALGKRFARLPIDVHLARILLDAQNLGVLKEALVLVAALSVANFWQENQEKNNFEKKSTLTVENLNNLNNNKNDKKPFSQFIECLNIWKNLENKKHHHLTPQKIAEWRDIHSQLTRLFVKENLNDWHHLDDVVFYQKIHCALLSGLLGFVGLKTDSYYQGIKNLKFYLHPSLNIKQKPQWIMAYDLIETSRLFAHFVAEIKPEWIEKAAKKLLQKHYENPHWSKKNHAAMITEKVNLFGLNLFSNRKVFLDKINLKQARSIFIEYALVKMEIAPDVLNQFSFLKHNLKMVESIKQLEIKQRRLDILIDESLIVDFYHQTLPENVFDFKTLKIWLKNNEKKLFLNQKDLMNHQAQGITSFNFPNTMNINGQNFQLVYQFNPHHHHDGVTLKLPIIYLNSISHSVLDWLVPGLRKNKVLFLLKTLPQKYRVKMKNLEVLSEEFLNKKNLNLKESMVNNLIPFLREQYAFEARGWNLNKELFRVENLPDYFLMNIELLDENGNTICFSRNLNDLKKQYAHNLSLSLQKEDIQTWNFGELNDIQEIEINGQKIIGYPALCFENNILNLNVFDEEELAFKKHKNGLLELFKRNLKIQLKNCEKNCPKNLMLVFVYLGDANELKKQWIDKIFEECCLKEPLPKNENDFLKRIEESKSRIVLVGQEMAKLFVDILEVWQKQKTNKLNSIKVFPVALKDIEKQRNYLIHSKFIQNNQWEHLKHFPRYLNAMTYRMEKIRENPERDFENQKKVNYFLNLWERAQKEYNYKNQNINDFYWMIEELRVSLFANHLKTPMPVSVKRLEKIWASLK